ncbi:Peptidyl-tRNA hydrolase ICT1, mitochondrial, partial [Mucuna pruriens]
MATGSGSTRMVLLVKEMLQLSSSTLPFSSLCVRVLSPPLPFSLQLRRSPHSIRCASSDSDSSNKVSSRLSQVQQLLQQAEHRALSADKTPPPKITLDHVTVSFARSGGPGGQNVNKVNTKVDMRFNVNNAYWLSDRVRDKILQMEKNRINKDGELVISSTKTRTQKGNIEDALAKLQKQKRRWLQGINLVLWQEMLQKPFIFYGVDGKVSKQGKRLMIFIDLEKDGVITSVRTLGGETEDFPIKIELHHDPALSLYLFNLVLEVLTGDMQKIIPNCMLFVDDIVLIEELREPINFKIELWRQILGTKSFHLSRSKIEYIHCNFSLLGRCKRNMTWK